MSRNFLGNPPAGPITGADSFPGIQGGADVLFSLAALLAEAWDRDNHTGSQPQSSVTGLTAALASKLAGLLVKDEGSTVLAAATGLNFAGSGVSVTDAGSGTALVTIAATAGGGAVVVAAPGGTDDTAAVVSARTAAGAGGTVIFAPSTTPYVVTGLAASIANQHWDVRPGATIKLKNASNTPVIDVTADGVRIDGGGTLDGNRANQTSTDIGHSGLGTTACVRIISRSNVTVRDLTMVDGGSNGVLIDASSNVTIEANRISGCSPTGNSKQVMVIDVVGNSTEIKIRRNRIDAVSRTNGCISVLAQDASSVISNLDISGNLCLVGEGGGSVETLGIELFTIATAFIRGATISQNIVTGPSGVTSSDLIYGISCGGNSSGADDGNTRIAVTGNVVVNCPALSIEVVGSGVAVSGNSTYNCGPIAVLAVTTTGGVRSVSVTGNTILDSIDTSYCLRIDGDTNGIYGLVVTGNTVRNAAGGYAMLIDGEVYDSVFSGNSFSDLAGPGIGVAGPLVDSIIAGNVIDLTGVGGTTADGILLADAGIAGCLIHGNVIKAAPRTGIYVNAAVDHLSIVGNQVSGCAAYGILATTATNLSIASNDSHDNTTANYLTTGSTFTTHVINGAGG